MIRFNPFYFFLALTLALGLLPREAAAVQVMNKSQQKIAAAVIRVKGERKTTLFVKILRPGTELDFMPPEGDGALLLSVKVFDTKETLRIPDVASAARFDYENGQLVPQAQQKT